MTRGAVSGGKADPLKQDATTYMPRVLAGKHESNEDSAFFIGLLFLFRLRLFLVVDEGNAEKLDSCVLGMVSGAL